ncbi:MAG: hypothetical protein ACREUE_04690 [Panacagrimonas sp.]
MSVRWWTSRKSLRHAGIRIRAHLVMRELQRQGCAVGWYDPGTQDPELRTLVVHMRYDDQTYQHATALKSRGVRLVVDLCDNHFYAQPDQLEKARRGPPLRRMVRLADDVIVSTPELGGVVQAQCDLAVPPRVIPDAQDDLNSVPIGWKQHLRADIPAALMRWRVRSSIAKGRVPLIWVGHHGTYDDVGMLDLLRIRAELERLDRACPLHLSVVSNNREKFRAHFEGWTFPVTYGEWSAHQFGPIARLHRIALVPVIENEFTRGKTANRVITAFMHGLAVVADPLPSYRPFADALCFGNWAESIERYAKDEARRRRDVERGRRLSEDCCSIATVAHQWRGILGI